MIGGIIRLLERKTTLSDGEKQIIIQALKLQKLVEEQIKYECELNEGFNDYEKTALYLLETLLEESKK
jgi:hypothetical protein